MRKSIKGNFVFNSLKTTGGTLFPLITFPYITRILSPDGLGKYNFAATITAYFVLIATFGMPVYGTKEIAKAGNDIEKRSRIAQELFIIHFIVTGIVYGLFLFTVFIVPKFYLNANILLLMGTGILLPLIGVEWLYQGLENYKYIAIRSIFFQIVSVFLIFIFVKNKTDYLLYALFIIIAGGKWVIGGFGNLVNFINARNFVVLKLAKDLELKRHVKPLATLFLITVVGSIYINIDTVMLGFLTTDRIVGLYAGSIKIVKGILPIITSMSMVLLSRSSYYHSNNMETEFDMLTQKSIDYVLLASIPLATGIFCTANELVAVFCGPEFIDSVLTVKILCPVILFISLSSFFTIHFLPSINKEKIIIVPFLIGSLVNIILNFILIPLFQQNGSAIAYTLTEFIVLSVLIFISRHILSNKFNWKNVPPVILGSFFIFLFSAICKKLISGNFAILFASAVSSVIIYFLVLLLFRHYLLINFISKIMKSKGGSSDSIA